MTTIDPKDFLGPLLDAGVGFFAGVPDSVLKEFCWAVDAALPAGRHIIAANEGAAVGLATGAHIADGKVPAVYLQNSGLGNAVNPLLSLADPEVYGVPMLVIVGWRGAPGTRDEPQHLKQGRLTPPLLDAMEIPWWVLQDHAADMAGLVRSALDSARSRRGPVAILVHNGLFAAYDGPKPAAPPAPELGREEAIGHILEYLRPDDLVVGTTGMVSRELHDLRVAAGQTHDRDFMMVGSMGHAMAIAVTLAAGRPERRVVCLDGDGAALMHLGSLSTVAALKPANLLHIVVNNGAHDSVGGQPSLGFQVDFPAIATACGYPRALRIDSAAGIAALLGDNRPGPVLADLHVRKGARKDLGRPKIGPRENLDRMMRLLGSAE